jgi:hypothetical protein
MICDAVYVCISLVLYRACHFSKQYQRIARQKPVVEIYAEKVEQDRLVQEKLAEKGISYRRRLLQERQQQPHVGIGGPRHGGNSNNDSGDSDDSNVSSSAAGGHAASAAHSTMTNTSTSTTIAGTNVTATASTGVLEDMRAGVEARLSSALKRSTGYVTDPNEWLPTAWDQKVVYSDLIPRSRCFNPTGLPRVVLDVVLAALCKLPDDFDAHPHARQMLRNRRNMLEKGKKVDWATAEMLAFGTLMIRFNPELGGDDAMLAHHSIHPNCHVRLSGQDCERGTYNQRHVRLFDQTTFESCVPLELNLPRCLREAEMRNEAQLLFMGAYQRLVAEETHGAGFIRSGGVIAHHELVHALGKLGFDESKSKQGVDAFIRSFRDSGCVGSFQEFMELVEDQSGRTHGAAQEGEVASARVTMRWINEQHEVSAEDPNATN